MFNSLITITVQNKPLCVIAFQFLYVLASNRYGKATKPAARREHGVENASNAKVNLEQALQKFVHHIDSLSVLQEKVIPCCHHLVFTHRLRAHFLCNRFMIQIETQCQHHVAQKLLTGIYDVSSDSLPYMALLSLGVILTNVCRVRLDCFSSSSRREYTLYCPHQTIPPTAHDERYDGCCFEILLAFPLPSNPTPQHYH
jgi:hypothetical protein